MSAGFARRIHVCARPVEASHVDVRSPRTSNRGIWVFRTQTRLSLSVRPLSVKSKLHLLGCWRRRDHSHQRQPWPLSKGKFPSSRHLPWSWGRSFSPWAIHHAGLAETRTRFLVPPGDAFCGNCHFRFHSAFGWRFPGGTSRQSQLQQNASALSNWPSKLAGVQCPWLRGPLNLQRHHR